MIVLDFQPLSIVENIGFLQYTNELNPVYKPPSRKVLSTKLLPEEYNMVRLHLKDVLKKSRSCCSYDRYLDVR